ncbi:protein of unknown function [Hyphomicrobium sp. 1Nfss2.1]
MVKRVFHVNQRAHGLAMGKSLMEGFT